MLTRRTLLTALATIALMPGRARAARLETFAIAGLAIGGTDPVAYFDGGGPVAGMIDFRLMWKGAEWRFASASNLMAFEMDPSAYAPHYGGYCAYAMAQGALASTDPEAWTLHGGKLYLNFSQEVRALWRQDIAGYILQANSHWPQVLEG